LPDSFENDMPLRLGPVVRRKSQLKTSIALALGLLLTTASGAMAAGPPTTLIAGSAAGTTAAGTTAQCLSYGGVSTFQRATATSSVHPQAVIGLPGIGYQANSTTAAVYRYGVGILTFTSATTGSVSFDTISTNTKLPAKDIVNFTTYSQQWVAAQNALIVRFKLQLPDCNLPVNLLFRAGAPS
jgi:membrane protease YdiL (CAAX protease family)